MPVGDAVAGVTWVGGEVNCHQPGHIVSTAHGQYAADTSQGRQASPRRVSEGALERSVRDQVIAVGLRGEVAAPVSGSGGRVRIAAAR